MYNCNPLQRVVYQILCETLSCLSADAAAYVVALMLQGTSSHNIVS